MDKTFLIISTALFLSGSRLFAQAAKEQLKKCESDSIDELKVYSIVDDPPEYQGGMSELYRIFGENLSIPKEEDHMPISSKFYISFVIDTTGNVRNFCATDNLEINSELIEQINHWKTGSHEGKKVPVRMMLPICIRFG